MRYVSADSLGHANYLVLRLKGFYADYMFYNAYWDLLLLLGVFSGGKALPGR